MQAYYILSTHIRLLSLQCFFSENQSVKYIIDHQFVTIILPGNTKLMFPYAQFEQQSPYTTHCWPKRGYCRSQRHLQAWYHA